MNGAVRGVLVSFHGNAFAGALESGIELVVGSGGLAVFLHASVVAIVLSHALHGIHPDLELIEVVQVAVIIDGNSDHVGVEFFHHLVLLGGGHIQESGKIFHGHTKHAELGESRNLRGGEADLLVGMTFVVQACSLDDEVATHILALVGGVHVTGDADEHLAFHRTVDIAVALDLGSADQNGNKVRQGHFDFRHGARGDNRGGFLGEER